MHNFGAQSFRLAMAMMAVGISTSSAHAYLDPGTGSIAPAGSVGRHRGDCRRHQALLAQVSFADRRGQAACRRAVNSPASGASRRMSAAGSKDSAARADGSVPSGRPQALRRPPSNCRGTRPPNPPSNREPGSYRDRNSSVFYHNGEIFRGISAKALANWKRLTATRFFADFTTRGNIVPTEMVSEPNWGDHRPRHGRPFSSTTSFPSFPTPTNGPSACSRMRLCCISISCWRRSRRISS